MTTITTKITGRRIEVDVPEDWPDGTEVEIHPLATGGVYPAECAIGSRPLSPDEWRRLLLETAGKWYGEFERPEQGAYEEREPLS
jgi:hypothetical protein